MNIIAEWPNTKFTFYGKLYQLWQRCYPCMYMIDQNRVEDTINKQGNYLFIDDISGTEIIITNEGE